MQCWTPVCPELGWVLTARTVSDKDVATEPTWMSLWRVLAVSTRPNSPTGFKYAEQHRILSYFTLSPGRLMVV